MTTTNLSDFGYRELVEASKILATFKDSGYPDDFSHDGIQLMMNQSSGNVFLTNDDCQVLMMNGDMLEMFYTCPECGFEGFVSDFCDEHAGNKECAEYNESIGAKKR